MKHTDDSSWWARLYWYRSTHPHFHHSTTVAETPSLIYPSIGWQAVSDFQESSAEKTCGTSLSVLEDLACSCNAWQRVESVLIQFRVLLGSRNLHFNEERYMNTIFINHVPVILVVDAANKFRFTQLVVDASTNSVCATVIEYWESVYTGLFHRIWLKRGSCLGDNFSSVAKGAHIDLARFWIEAISSLEIRKRYHQQLISVYSWAEFSIDSHILTVLS